MNDLPEKLRQTEGEASAQLEPRGELTTPTVPPEVAQAGVKIVPSVPTIPVGTPVELAKEAAPLASLPQTIVSTGKPTGGTNESLTWLAEWRRAHKKQTPFKKAA